MDRLFQVINNSEGLTICDYATDPMLDKIDRSKPLDERTLLALMSPDKIEAAGDLPYSGIGKSVPYAEGGFNFLPTGGQFFAGNQGYGTRIRAWTSTNAGKDANSHPVGYMVAVNLDDLELYRPTYYITPWYLNSMIPIRCKKNN